MAKLYFKYGAMNSGKSTSILQVAHNYEERGLKVLLFKPEVDTKGEDTIVSRLDIQRKVDYLIKKNDVLNKDLIQSISKEKPDLILVDEVQFLNRENINQLFSIATNENIPVMCFGLRTDFTGKGFEASSRLLEIAHQLEEMKTICRCGKKAILNARSVDGEFILEGPTLVIDDSSKVEYEAMCGSCYLEKNNIKILS